ncbi:MAG: CHAP domain-containing protein [Clostridia bacterium]|nr:CHAP domain-containing protein [Clostridia bacterium]
MKRIVSLLAVTALLLTCLPAMAFTTASAAYENTHVNTGDMIADIVAVAKTQVGYLEGSYAGTTAGSNNVQKYGLWYDQNVDNIGVKAAPWCAAFVSWCANQAGVPSSIVYYHAYCPYGVNWFKNRGLFQYAASRGGSYTPKAGDIVYFAPAGSSESSHIGLVTGVSGGYVYTIEGNTSGQNGEVNDGGGVFAKSYSLSYSRLLGYGTPNYETKVGGSAEKLGTYKINVTSSLNVRKGAGSSYDIIGELHGGDLVNVTELSNGWGKITLSDGQVGWCAVGDYGEYIGIDALNTTFEAAWNEDQLAYTTADNGAVTFTNNSTVDPIAIDMPLPLKIGNKTTPSFNISVTANKGGYYFGLTQDGTGYFMMRDCNSGDELVHEESAPYMRSDEQLQIDISYWWNPEESYQIDTVRLYLDAGSSVTVNYCYFAAQANVVINTSYNMRNGGSAGSVVTTPDPLDLMLPSTLDIVDRSKTGSYSYVNGMLTVVSEDDNGYEVSFAPNVTFAPETLSNLVFSVDAAASFDIELLVTTADGERTFSLRDDFYPELCSEPDGDYIPAMKGSAALDLHSCYVWNNLPLVDGQSTIKAVVIRVKGQGTVIVNEVQMAANDVLTYFGDHVTKTDSSSATVEPQPPVDNGVMGDVNGDDTVTTVDARLIISHLLGASSLTEAQIALADFDGNGTVTTADVRAILSGLIG